MLYGGCPGNGGGAIEGTGEAVGAARFRLVVISRTRVTGNQTGTGEMTSRTGDCRSGDPRRSEERSRIIQNNQKSESFLVDRSSILKRCRLFLYFKWETQVAKVVTVSRFIIQL